MRRRAGAWATADAMPEAASPSAAVPAAMKLRLLSPPPTGSQQPQPDMSLRRNVLVVLIALLPGHSCCGLSWRRFYARVKHAPPLGGHRPQPHGAPEHVTQLLRWCDL